MPYVTDISCILGITTSVSTIMSLLHDIQWTHTDFLFDFNEPSARHSMICRHTLDSKTIVSLLHGFHRSHADFRFNKNDPAARHPRNCRTTHNCNYMAFHAPLACLPPPEESGDGVLSGNVYVHTIRIRSLNETRRLCFHNNEPAP